jgi:hypothetical protein
LNLTQSNPPRLDVLGLVGAKLAKTISSLWIQIGPKFKGVDPQLAESRAITQHQAIQSREVGEHGMQRAL